MMRRLHLNRGLVHLLGVLVIAFLAMAQPQVAHAATPAEFNWPTGTDCMRPPIPSSPNGGVAGMIDPGPEKPLTGDPFAKGPNKPSIYDVYGYAGLEIVAADPGCVQDKTTAPFWTQWLNNYNQVNIAAVAVAVRLYRVVMGGDFGSIFDPIQIAVQERLGVSVFVPLIGLAVILSGTYMVWQHKKGKLKDVGKQSFGMLAIMSITVATMVYSLTIGAMFDRGVTNVISGASQAATGAQGREPADVVAATLHESLLWTTWEMTTFGSGTVNDAAAKEFGPRLFKAAAFSRTEQAKIDADPASATELVDQKQEDYKKVLTEIKDKYPTAYQFVAGNHVTPQFGFVTVGLVGVAASLAILLLALIKLAYSMVVARFGVGVLPGAAPIVQYPTMQKHARKLVDMVVTAAIAAIAYGLLALLYTGIGIRMILSPASSWPWFVKLLAMVVMTAAIIWMAKWFKLNVHGDLKRMKAHFSRMDVSGAYGWVKEHTPGSGSGATSAGRQFKQSAEEDAPKRQRAPETDMPTRTVKSGAAAKAATYAAATVATGGTVTVGALALEATKGAATQTIINGAARKKAETVNPGLIFDPDQRPTQEPPVAPRMKAGNEWIYDVYTPSKDGAKAR